MIAEDNVTYKVTNTYKKTLWLYLLELSETIELYQQTSTDNVNHLKDMHCYTYVDF